MLNDTFTALGMQNANAQRFGCDHIGYENRSELQTFRTDHPDLKTMPTNTNNRPAPQKVALTFIGRYTNDSFVSRFGHVKPQP